VFNDVLSLNFSKFKQHLQEHNDTLRLQEDIFREEHRDDNEEFKVKVDERLEEVSTILEVLAKAAEFAKHARAWVQLENIVKYTFNCLNFMMVSPLQLRETGAWKHLLLIAESTLTFLQLLKDGGTVHMQTASEISDVKNQTPGTLDKEGRKTVAFAEDTMGGGRLAHDESHASMTTMLTEGGAGEKDLKWFERVSELDVNMHTSFVAFTIQALMHVEKWESLVDLSNNLNKVTDNHYASYLLPFIIHAQTTLYEAAASRTNGKRNELEVRIKQFENWKLTNKKKRSRQAMITGEIPPEEQEFMKDKAALEKEIFRLEVIENVLKGDKNSSEKLLENTKRDANVCEESLKDCRKLYF
jgi:hypothetical protein